MAALVFQLLETVTILLSYYFELFVVYGFDREI